MPNNFRAKFFHSFLKQTVTIKWRKLHYFLISNETKLYSLSILNNRCKSTNKSLCVIAIPNNIIQFLEIR